MENLNSFLTPGMRVTHPDRPDWGIGQVQSNISCRVTVNFQNQGKTVIDSKIISLQPYFDENI